MKLFKTNFVLLLMIAAFLAASVTGCKKDVVAPKPSDETIDKGHEDWGKITFRFHEGHLHGSLFHGHPVYKDKNNRFSTVQEISYAKDKEGNVVPDTKEPIRFVAGIYYALEIVYYNKKGERMNSQLTTPEMSKIHQHFFMPKNIMDLKTNAPVSDTSNMMRYWYRDTNPEDVQINKSVKPGSVILSALTNDPVGLKGYFYINKPYQSYDLQVVLVHVIKGSKYDDAGKAYPFNQPSLRILGSVDLSLPLKIKVFTQKANTDAEQAEYIKDIAKEYGITVAEVETLINKIAEGIESGDYHM